MTQLCLHLALLLCLHGLTEAALVTNDAKFASDACTRPTAATSGVTFDCGWRSSESDGSQPECRLVGIDGRQSEWTPGVQKSIDQTGRIFKFSIESKFVEDGRVECRHRLVPRRVKRFAENSVQPASSGGGSLACQMNVTVGSVFCHSSAPSADDFTCQQKIDGGVKQLTGSPAVGGKIEFKILESNGETANITCYKGGSPIFKQQLTRSEGGCSLTNTDRTRRIPRPDWRVRCSSSGGFPSARHECWNENGVALKMQHLKGTGTGDLVSTGNFQGQRTLTCNISQIGWPALKFDWTFEQETFNGTWLAANCYMQYVDAKPGGATAFKLNELNKILFTKSKPMQMCCHCNNVSKTLTSSYGFKSAGLSSAACSLIDKADTRNRYANCRISLQNLRWTMGAEYSVVPHVPALPVCNFDPKASKILCQTAGTFGVKSCQLKNNSMETELQSLNNEDKNVSFVVPSLSGYTNEAAIVCYGKEEVNGTEEAFRYTIMSHAPALPTCEFDPKESKILCQTDGTVGVKGCQVEKNSMDTSLKTLNNGEKTASFVVPSLSADTNEATIVCYGKQEVNGTEEAFRYTIKRASGECSAQVLGNRQIRMSCKIYPGIPRATHKCSIKSAQLPMKIEEDATADLQTSEATIEEVEKPSDIRCEIRQPFWEVAGLNTSVAHAVETQPSTAGVPLLVSLLILALILLVIAVMIVVAVARRRRNSRNASSETRQAEEPLKPTAL